MSAVLVSGAVIDISTPEVLTLTTTSFSVSSSRKVKLDGKGFILWPDIVSAFASFVSDYVTTAFPLTGSLKAGTITSTNNVSITNIGGQDVMSANVSGSLNLLILVSATSNTSFDPVATVYTCTWSISSTGQGTDKIFTN